MAELGGQLRRGPDRRSDVLKRVALIASRARKRGQAVNSERSGLHGLGDRGVAHVDPVAGAGAADRSIVRTQPDFAKKESATSASSRSAAQAAQAGRSDRFARA